MSGGMRFAPPKGMRPLGCFLLGIFALVACGADDGSVTDDSGEINEGRGSLERKIDPQLAAPKSDLIGAKLDEIFTTAAAKGTVGSPKKSKDCETTQVKSGKDVIVERVTCKSSDVVRILDENGRAKSEHTDLNGDGKVDRYTGEDGAVAQYNDTDCDGKIDVVVERVDKVKDFSLKGYGEEFPKSKFLFRVREDRNHDGKLDHEKLTARGVLRPAESSQAEEE
jgi:hypothetical protein